MRQYCGPVGYLLILITTSSGCSAPSGPPTEVVSGNVTLDGKPLPQGTIGFFPVDGAGATSGAAITNGVYTANVPLGSKRVEIRAFKVIGQKVVYEGDPNSPKTDIKEETIPPRYNNQSDLKITVVKGKNPANFSLESPKE